MSRRIRPEARARAKQLRRDMTGPERKLWKLLRDHRLQGLKFRRQQPFGPYIVDFFCAAANLIIELDGASHADRGEYDQARQACLEQAGYHVLRIDNDDVLAADIEPVLLAILKATNLSHPSPPEGEGQIRSASEESG